MAEPIPDSAELEFVRNKTGAVHILPHVPEPWEHGYTEPVVIPPGRWHEALAAVVTGPGTPMLCGRRVKFAYPGAPGDFTDTFPDEELCQRCVRALGDKAPRAFEHRRPGDDDHA